jgi:hypothetical protein
METLSSEALEQIANSRNREHWVCFDCQKMFKRPSCPENVASGPGTPARTYLCPQCRQPMLNLGLYFEPPRRGDNKAWRKIELLVEYGYFYYTEGSKAYIDKIVLGKPPASIRDLREKLETNKEYSLQLGLWRRGKYLKQTRAYNEKMRRLNP